MFSQHIQRNEGGKIQEWTFQKVLLCGTTEKCLELVNQQGRPIITYSLWRMAFEEITRNKTEREMKYRDYEKHRDAGMLIKSNSFLKKFQTQSFQLFRQKVLRKQQQRAQGPAQSDLITHLIVLHDNLLSRSEKNNRG